MSADLVLAPHELVVGRYQLIAALGDGTFGQVWRAADRRLADRPVAVKFLKREFLRDAAVTARFDAEADALVKASHPNVVAVLDRGEWRGQRFLVVEYIPGGTLQAWLDGHRAARQRFGPGSDQAEAVREAWAEVGVRWE